MESGEAIFVSPMEESGQDTPSEVPLSTPQNHLSSVLFFSGLAVLCCPLVSSGSISCTWTSLGGVGFGVGLMLSLP